MVSVPGPRRRVETSAAGRGVQGTQGVHRSFDSGPAAAQAIAATLAPRGISAIDAPVSGGVRGAATGKLAIMASGPAAAMAQVQSLA